MNIYNKTIHRIKKYTPNEVFYSTNNDLFLKVKNNIIDNYNKSISNLEYNFKVNEKSLMNNTFIKTNNKYNDG